MTALERFEAKFEPEPMTGCWLWTAKVNHKGYGRFCGATSAHRFAYIRFIGPVPDGKEIDHICRVRSCVNPTHLQALTHAENLRRRLPRSWRGTHCKQGHPYSGDNIRVRESGGRNGGPARACRECQRQWRRESYWRAKAASQ